MRVNELFVAMADKTTLYLRFAKKFILFPILVGCNQTSPARPMLDLTDLNLSSAFGLLQHRNASQKDVNNL